MAKTFNLQIVTPDSLFYKGEVEIVVVRTLLGEEGFLAGHTWVCKLLGTGKLRLKEPGSGEHRLANISGGFVDVHGDVLVFTDKAEWSTNAAGDTSSDTPTA